MRIVYFSCQMPFPATHGGLVDDWARINAMSAAGAQLALVTWYAEAGSGPDPAAMAALNRVAKVVHALPIAPSMSERLRRLVNLARWPSHVSSRMPAHGALAQLWQSLDQFKPEAIWLDALYPTALAQRAAKRYGVPMFYRSHNIEHRYMQGQVKRAVALRDRLAWSMNLPHLRRVEFETWAVAKAVFDISMDDLQWWQAHGFSHGHWLPPLVTPDKAASLSGPNAHAPQYDVGYLGNLRTPNNVEGILWFLREVWPMLLAQNAGLNFLLAGSTPSALIKEAAQVARNVTLLENPPDVGPVMRNAKVLINPVFAGSGVNVKSVEMLFTPARLVSSPQGVAGLPVAVQNCFDVASDAQGFADAINQAVRQGWLDKGEALLEREAVRAEFGFRKIEQVLAIMRDMTDAYQEPRSR